MNRDRARITGVSGYLTRPPTAIPRLIIRLRTLQAIFAAGRDVFWLARWLQVRGIEVDAIHSTSVAVAREHSRAKTDRLGTAMPMHVFLRWLCGKRGHCMMVAIPTRGERMPSVPSESVKAWFGRSYGPSRTGFG
ncbi:MULTISPECIES: hypothetical protein [Acidiphilium]|uniref:Transposase n=1 Tax=Acidiphilium iwatense TaxID=768198 RepID=A0ABS9E0Z0_9PROT|nr:MULTISPECIES: hypothetical protein [Acidiphilium]MCF3948677.1 hypothetical protein [Acidiphilium iwatense]